MVEGGGEEEEEARRILAFAHTLARLDVIMTMEVTQAHKDFDKTSGCHWLVPTFPLCGLRFGLRELNSTLQPLPPSHQHDDSYCQTLRQPLRRGKRQRCGHECQQFHGCPQSGGGIEQVLTAVGKQHGTLRRQHKSQHCSRRCCWGYHGNTWLWIHLLTHKVVDITPWATTRSPPRGFKLPKSGLSGNIYIIRAIF